LPNNDHARILLREALKTLAKEFDDPAAEVDSVVHNASRICRLPGTTNRKGPNTPERPWRVATVLDLPDGDLGIVSAEMLAALASPAEPPVSVPFKPINWAPVATDESGPEAWAKAALRGILAEIEGAPEGQRNNVLNSQAMRAGGLLWIGAFGEDETRAALLSAAEAAGLGRIESEKTINSGIEAGKAKPCPAPPPREDRAKPGPKPKPKASATDGLADGELIILRASEITPRAVEWLWPGRIAIGKLTTFAGWGGLGKSFITADLAARISRGEEIPFGGGLCFEPGGVLLVNTEDDPDDTTVPRLIEAGADLDRITFLKSKALTKLTLDDLATWDLALAQMGGARMIVIDPATAHLGGVDDHKNSGLRAILAPLMLWAAERRVAIVLVTHLNKPAGGGRVEALARVVGGVAWVNAVRGAILFARDPADRTRCLMMPGKNNLGPEAPGLAYRIVKTAGLARVEWIEEVSTSADDAMSGSPSKSSGPDPELWLIERFREARSWTSEEIKAKAAAAGVSNNKLFAAKKSLAIRAEKYTDETGETFWRWVVPPDWAKLTD
jgi:hypothetical protein